MTKQYLQELIIKHFYDKKLNVIDLEGLDFGDMRVSLIDMKAKNIYNGGQQAKFIDNGHQKANYIRNWYQQANKEIHNEGQKVVYKGNEEEHSLIKLLKEGNEPTLFGLLKDINDALEKVSYEEYTYTLKKKEPDND